jgi:steroid delta-isomerase-like uncharacterized protein
MLFHEQRKKSRNTRLGQKQAAARLMTTEQNKVVVRAFVEAINRQDWRRFDELVAPDFVRHSSTFGQPPISSREQLREFLRGEAVTFPDARETIHRLVAEENMVAVYSAFRGTQKGPMGPYPASGRTLSADFISLYRIEDGRLVEAWVEWDSLSGLVQLGHLALPSSQSLGTIPTT